MKKSVLKLICGDDVPLGKVTRDHWIVLQIGEFSDVVKDIPQ